MKPLFVLLCTLFFFAASVAQPNPDTLWTRTYGGVNDEGAYDVQPTRDGGFALIGYRDPYFDHPYFTDYYLVKADESGELEWWRSIWANGGQACSGQQTSDGGYAIAGSCYSFEGIDFHMRLSKSDSLGVQQWRRDYYSGDMAQSVRQTTDGGYVLVGFSEEYDDFSLVRTDSLGDTLWTRHYGGSNYERPYCIQLTTDGGYIMTGSTISYGAGWCDFYLVKTDGVGDILWTRAYGGPEYEYAFWIEETNDGGYVVAGCTNSFGAGSFDFYVVKTDSLGDSLWTKTYGGGGDDIARCVRQTFDGGFIIAGHTYSFGEGTPEFANFYVVKISSIGDTLWTCTYGGSNEDFAYSVLQTSDSCFILAGQTRSFGAGAGDAYLIKTGPDPTAATEHFIPHPSLFTLSCFPNPFNPSTRISYALPKSGHATLTVFNLLGEQITTLADEIQSAGEHTITFDGSGLASGVYLSRLQSGDFARTQKMLLLK